MASKTKPIGIVKGFMRTKTNARRDAILAVAKQVFEEYGFENSSMALIAERLGSSKATLYRYFVTKEALFMELVRDYANATGGKLMGLLCGPAAMDGEHTLPTEAMQALTSLNPEADVEATLNRFATEIIGKFYTPESYAGTRMIIAAASANPEIGRVFYANSHVLGMRFVEDYFTQLVAAGKLRPCDTKLAANQFRGLLEAEFNVEGLFNVLERMTEAQVKDIVARGVDAFMRIYRPQGSQ